MSVTPAHPAVARRRQADAPRLVWGGHASRSLVTLMLVVHALALVWLGSGWERIRLLASDFREVPSEAFMTEPPPALRPLGYTEDDPAELTRFRAIAEPVVASAATDGEKLRRLGDYIYSMRRAGRPAAEREIRDGLSVILSSMQNGDVEGCSQMSAVLAAFWRSLGGHSRGISWATPEGSLGHFAVELYSTAYGRWVYYDMNVNGFGGDQQGTPLSLAALRSNLLTNEGAALHVNAVAHDWTIAEFESVLRQYPVEWYTLNNDALYMESTHRFGPLNRLFPWLVRLPYPWDRVADNLVGQRDRRFVVEGKVRVAGLLTIGGAHLFVLYLVAITLLCSAALRAPRRER